MRFKRTLPIMISLLLAVFISNAVNAAYLDDHTRSNVSRRLDDFFIHVENVYLDGKKIEDLTHKERITILGYALGRQAPNVQDDQKRKEIFELLENDLDRYCGSLAQFLFPDPGSAKMAVYKNQLWHEAQASMMGFYEDELIKTYGFDQWGIPNIFESRETGDEEPPEPSDPNSLVGKWRSEATNDVLRFVSEGNVIRGYLAEIGTSYTLNRGELMGVFTKTGSNVYEGKIKMKDTMGNETWLEGAKITVQGDYAFAELAISRVPVRYVRIW